MHVFFPKSIFGFVFCGIKIMLFFWLSASYPSPFLLVLPLFPPTSLWTHLICWVWPERISKVLSSSRFSEKILCGKRRDPASCCWRKKAALWAEMIPDSVWPAVCKPGMLEAQNKAQQGSFAPSDWQETMRQVELILLGERRYRFCYFNDFVLCVFQFSCLRKSSLPIFLMWRDIGYKRSVCVLISELQSGRLS